MTERILIYGIGGQGVQAMAKMISEAASTDGKEVVYTTSYGGQKRGGASLANVIISDKHIGAPMIIPGEMSTVVVLEDAGMDLYESYLKPGGMLMINSSMVTKKPTRTDVKVVYVDIMGLAQKVGNERTFNMVALGALVKLTGMTALETVLEQLKVVFTGRKAKLVPVNEEAIKAGYENAGN